MATLLLVEDDLELACAVHRELAQSGFQVTIATSSEAARALGRTFDAGVFDLSLADECAVELALELVAAERVGRVLFFTGASWQPVLRRAMKVGPVIEQEQGPDGALGGAQAALGAAERRRLCVVGGCHQPGERASASRSRSALTAASASIPWNRGQENRST